MALKIDNYSLYLVISEEYSLGKTALEVARQAISGGVDIIQLREKNKPKDELLKLARELSKICNEERVIFIVNDDPLIAKETQADGVHLGQGDLQKFSLAKARALLGRDKIIGVSTHSLDEFKSANQDEVDYIAYGPIFPTKTKDYFLGAKDIKEIMAIARKPVFFIGGVDLNNLDELLSAGAKNIALIRGIMQSEDIKAASRIFKNRLIQQRKPVTVIVRINGKAEVVAEKINILELVKHKNLLAENIVIEHNLRIVPKNEWWQVNLNENDTLEIVNFMGGG